MKTFWFQLYCFLSRNEGGLQSQILFTIRQSALNILLININSNLSFSNNENLSCSCVIFEPLYYFYHSQYHLMWSLLILFIILKLILFIISTILCNVWHYVFVRLFNIFISLLKPISNYFHLFFRNDTNNINY